MAAFAKPSGSPKSYSATSSEIVCAALLHHGPSLFDSDSQVHDDNSTEATEFSYPTVLQVRFWGGVGCFVYLTVSAGLMP